MKPFDLAFIASVLFVFGSLLWMVTQWLRQRPAAALRHGRRVAVFVGGYLAIVVIVAVTTPQRVLTLGQARRFDDWCITVSDAVTADHIDTTSAAPGKFVIVTLRVFSEARRVSQAAPQASVHLLDVAGHRFEVYAPGQQAFERQHGIQTAVGSRLPPLGSFTTTRVFHVPASLDQVDVATPHGGGPGAFIIGDDANPLHPPTVFRIPL